MGPCTEVSVPSHGIQSVEIENMSLSVVVFECCTVHHFAGSFVVKCNKLSLFKSALYFVCN